MLSNITAAGDGRQGVAVLCRRGGARVAELLTNDTWRSEMTIFVSTAPIADCTW